MCSCTSSSFLALLPLRNPSMARPISQNRRLIRRRLLHSIINCSFHESYNLSSSETESRSRFGSISSYNLTFPMKLSRKVISCSSSSSLPSEEDVVVELENGVVELSRDSDLIQLVGEEDIVSKGFKQMMKRSNLVAKEVITIESALSLGFISQLWVDTSSWLVMVVEIKPSLLSGECERFLLKDIVRVGDVVLVDDETVLDTEFKMVGLETLVGYKVVTPGQRNIGKVRSYSFNVNSGSVESLELDAFGVAFLPSSLVSTYRLDVEDIIEVFEDIIVVHEAFRKQRLTKGLWDTQFVSEYSDVEELESSSERRRQRRSKRSSRKKRDSDDEEWDMFG